MEEIILSQMDFHETFVKNQPTDFMCQSVLYPIFFHDIIFLSFCQHYTVLFTMESILFISII